MRRAEGKLGEQAVVEAQRRECCKEAGVVLADEEEGKSPSGI